MGPVSSKENELAAILREMSLDELRFLCSTFKLRVGGGKGDVVNRLLTSKYAHPQILEVTRRVMFARAVTDFVTRDYLARTLQGNRLSMSGTKVELARRLIENDLFEPPRITELLTPQEVRELYYSLYGSVPVEGQVQAKAAILQHFHLGEGDSRRATPATGAGSGFSSDVALSFAGEDRRIATSLAKDLGSAGVKVFYDEFYRSELWGRNLSEEFRKRYGEKTRFVIP